MARILSDLIVKKGGDREWELVAPLEYHVGNENSNEIIIIPAGFKTDLASTPRFIQALLPQNERYAIAAALHDFLYTNKGKLSNKTYTRKESDLIFLEAMKVLNVPLWKRQLMFGAVMTFGWIYWNK